MTIRYGACILRAGWTRASAHQGNWKQQQQLPRISARPSRTRGTGLCLRTQKTAMQLQHNSGKTKQLRSQEYELAGIPKSSCIARWLSSFLCVWLSFFSACYVGTKGRWIHQICSCTVKWSSASPLWQGPSTRSEWTGRGKEFHMTWRKLIFSD